MRSAVWAVFLVMLPATLIAQDSAVSYWFQFADKANTPYSIYNPSAFLSAQAIERRNTQDIPFDQRDLPVSPAYKRQLSNVVERLMVTSKWLNGAVATIVDTPMLNKAKGLAFIDTAYRVKGTTFPTAVIGVSSKDLSKPSYAYGAGLHQIEMLNGQFLHQLGYRGRAMTIAVLDAGFRGFQELRAFQHLRTEKRIPLKQNFVNPGASVSQSGTHGTSVLSVMAGRLSDTFTGVAPEASYYLMKSENPRSEFLVEEIAWVSAAEAADSAGAQIINSSLGYSRFEDSLTDHTYRDMDGNTTLITKGADIAADKGMLVISSAGNKGRNNWQYITAPADGDQVLAVGAVDSARKRVPFSSKGPSADGRIKPEVMAMGAETVLISPGNGRVAQSFGTSFSAPLISGLAACLWEAFPEATNTAVREAIIQSGSQTNTPDTLKGYGIPDFYEAYIQLRADQSERNPKSHLVRLYPNPFQTAVTVAFYAPKASRLHIRVRSPMGRTIRQESAMLEEGLNRIPLKGMNGIKSGVYILTLETDQTQVSRKLLHH